jgi:phosphoglycolate phosphatase
MTNHKPGGKPILNNPHPYSHLLWDWNGTLLDDLDLCLGVINRMLEDRELTALSREAYRAVFGFPVIDYYRKVGFNFEREPWEEVSTEFITAYESGRPACPLHPETQSTLETLSLNGYTQSILSASKAEYLARAVRDYGLEPFFLGWAGLKDHHARSKVEVGKRHLQDLSIDPTTTLMIGDTLHDAEVAEALGVDCWLISRGHQSRARLEHSGVPVLDSLQEARIRLTAA